MYKQRIVVLSSSESEGKNIQNQLEMLFGDIFNVDSFTMETAVNSYILADLVLSTSYRLTSSFVKSLTPSTDIYVLRRTIMRSGWEKVMQIPPKTRVYVAGDTDEAQITASTLCELGARHLEFNMGDEVDKSIKIAITTNSNDSIPSYIQQVVNIGERVLDPYALFDILGKMGQLNRRTSKIIINHMGEIMPRSPGFLSMIGNIEESKYYTELILNVADEGFVAFTSDGNIIMLNKWSEKLFNISAEECIGCNINTIFTQPELQHIVKEDEITDEVISFNKNQYIVNKYKLKEDSETIGGVILLRESTEIQKLELKFRQNNIKKGHITKYRFKDIIGKSEKMQESITLAKKMAKGDSGILIQGESGTGKELFAQAIHNASGRKDKPFVAFNCAAVSDTLIESELFGYDEGAFTGAKKGGKAGLFETAHTGTLFLDEIGDISRNMQASLLRVLQEKEIVRVGGTSIIPVDVRIIAATNQNLLQLVQEGKFRSDLFYRLHIMNLHLPALREHREDIPYLLEHMIRRWGVKGDIPKNVMDILQGYDWPGNARELANCVEYMINISNGDFCINDLPTQIIDNNGTAKKGAEIKNLEDEGETAVILNSLKLIKSQGTGNLGRRSLSKILEEYGFNYTENEIRSKLKKLQEINLVQINLGRSGTKITVKGEKLLKEIGHKYI